MLQRSIFSQGLLTERFRYAREEVPPVQRLRVQGSRFVGGLQRYLAKTRIDVHQDAGPPTWNVEFNDARPLVAFPSQGDYSGMSASRSPRKNRSTSSFLLSPTILPRSDKRICGSNCKRSAMML